VNLRSEMSYIANALNSLTSLHVIEQKKSPLEYKKVFVNITRNHGYNRSF